MNVFYEEDGGFKVAHVMSDIGTSLQVESVSGKRSKIKSNQVVLRFESPLGDFLPAAERLATDIDANFLWEVCGGNEFGSEELAREYFGHAPSPIESAAVAQKLHASPMYFYKRGKGRYQAAPAENLKAALASIERKQREAEQMAAWVADLKSGKLPDEMRTHMNMLLYKPDRNTLLVKAAEAAVAETQTPLAKLFFAAGAWADAASAPHDFHLGRFIAEYFPRGTEYKGALDLAAPDGLPTAPVAAYSIDDAATTEIDDAFSVTPQADGTIEVGIHIAAPALYFASDSELEKLARDRLSTVYFPGNKITMLPDAAIAHATLAEGRVTPVLSLYARLNASTLEVLATDSRIEQVRIAGNLRIHALEATFHDEAIARGEIAGEFGAELLTLYRFAKQLGAARGKGDNEQDRLDFDFRIDNGRVAITPRKRGNPIDTVVSELMIFTNSTWGKLLADNGVAGVYRAQANGKTRMTTDALPHEGLGVAQYAWSSSPLRRYVDLVNQRQLIALLRQETPLYPRRSPVLNELARMFDVTYDAYAEFQRNLERYWCLRYLEQENISELDATVIRDELFRANALPLIAKLAKSPALPGKSPLRVAVGTFDYWDISAQFTAVATATEAAPETPATP
jgi:exoribonuclease II